MKGLDHVKQEARKALGEKPDADALIEWLVKERVIVERHAMQFAMRMEFFAHAGERRFRTFEEVEEFVAGRFGVNRSTVYRARSAE